ncbi:hypothetical protein Ahy_B08g093964 isoform A [Arachis hypogaea]|uniref:Uncharacterized protein n=1 Tax=Arachis hypogaea TaxID=3818 RepID=A0A444Y7H1_ARAHY|nr:hypothetical protein Ahy_B08g093964 isoform A [Arachis hypogaea]
MRNIPTRTEIKEKKRVCKLNLREILNIILNWTEEKRAILEYYPIVKEQLTKLVIFSDAFPYDTYQFFQFGLIDTILIFNDLKIISEFSAGFVDAVKRFKNMIDNVNQRDVSLKFTNSQPIFNEEEECLVSAYQVIFIHEGRLASTLAIVFERTQKITKESHTRINYKSKNTLLASSKRNEIEEREMRLLEKTTGASYAPRSKISEESNNEMGSTHMIKEEDSASEASLNIIA